MIRIRRRQRRVASTHKTSATSWRRRLHPRMRRLSENRRHPTGRDGKPNCDIRANPKNPYTTTCGTTRRTRSFHAPGDDDTRTRGPGLRNGQGEVATNGGYRSTNGTGARARASRRRNRNRRITGVRSLSHSRHQEWAKDHAKHKREQAQTRRRPDADPVGKRKRFPSVPSSIALLSSPARNRPTSSGPAGPNPGSPLALSTRVRC